MLDAGIATNDVPNFLRRLALQVLPCYRVWQFSNVPFVFQVMLMSSSNVTVDSPVDTDSTDLAATFKCKTKRCAPGLSVVRTAHLDTQAQTVVHKGLIERNHPGRKPLVMYKLDVRPHLFAG